MGWISDRKTRTGHGLNSRKGAKAKGPLRLITGIRSVAESLFDYAYVDLECGHSGPSYADSPTVNVTKARCAKCGRIENVETIIV
jgi:phage-related protein